MTKTHTGDAAIRALAAHFGVTKKSAVLSEMQSRHWAPENFTKLSEVTDYMLTNALAIVHSNTPLKS
jgi:hypothetical protein